MSQHYETFTGEDAGTGQQFLLRVYTEQPVLRTVSVRPHEGATWGPEVIVREPAS